MFEIQKNESAVISKIFVFALKFLEKKMSRITDTSKELFQTIALYTKKKAMVLWFAKLLLLFFITDVELKISLLCKWINEEVK